MAAALWKTGSINATTTTLNGSITDVATTVVLTSSTGLQVPGVIVVDRIDSNDIATPTVREYISFTGISSNSLTGCTRGLGGSTAQSHSSGAKVEEVWTITHWNDFLDAFDAEHGSDGTHDTATLALLAGAQTFTGAKTFTTGLLEAVDITSGAGVNTLPTSTGTLVSRTTTDTLTNKRITKRTVTVTQHATPTINTDNTDVASITGLAQAVTSMTTNLSGTPVTNDALIISFTDDGTGRAITWGASFEASGTVALPTTTVASTRLDVGFLYNSVTSKWRCLATA